MEVIEMRKNYFLTYCGDCSDCSDCINHDAMRSRLHLEQQTSAQAQHQMQSGLLLDVVISQSAAVIQLLSSEDQTLLVRGNALLVLHLLLHLVNGVRRLDFQSNRLAGQGLDEDLHASAQAQHQVQRGFLLDVVVGQSTTIIQLLSGKDQALLVRGNTLLVLHLLLNLVDSIGGLHLQGDSLAGQSLNEDLHTVLYSRWANRII